MAEYKVNITDLNKRITIQHFTIVTSENNFDEEKWVNYKTIWARKRDLVGKTYYAAKATNSEDTVTFTVRYSKELEVLLRKNAKLKYRIKLKDIVYKIEFANNVQEANEWIEIKAVEENE